MRMFKRKINPIFVEDEQHNWGERRGGLRVLLLLMFLGVVAGLVAILAALPM